MSAIKPIDRPLLARRMHFTRSGVATPYVSDGDSARVLFFMNLSGAYSGAKGADQAEADARLFAAAPDLAARLKDLIAELQPYADEDDSEEPNSIGAVVTRARAALAKAGVQ